MYLKNKVLLSLTSIKLAAIFNLNYFEVNLALCHIISKYKTKTIKETQKVFIDLYNKMEDSTH